MIKWTPELDKELSILRDIGWTYEKIARKLGGTVPAVKKRYYNLPCYRQKVARREAEHESVAVSSNSKTDELTALVDLLRMTHDSGIKENEYHKTANRYDVIITTLESFVKQHV